MCEALFSVDISNFTNFVLLDFNVDFNNPSCHTFSHITNFMHMFSLSQVVDTSTHLSHNGHPSLIDLVFVSSIHSLLECVVIPPLYLTPTTLDCQSYCRHCYAPWRSLVCWKVWRDKHADFERANDMICDLELDEIFVGNDIRASWSNVKVHFLT